MLAITRIQLRPRHSHLRLKIDSSVTSCNSITKVKVPVCQVFTMSAEEINCRGWERRFLNDACSSMKEPSRTCAVSPKTEVERMEKIA